MYVVKHFTVLTSLIQDQAAALNSHLKNCSVTLWL